MKSENRVHGRMKGWADLSDTRSYKIRIYQADRKKKKKVCLILFYALCMWVLNPFNLSL